MPRTSGSQRIDTPVERTPPGDRHPDSAEAQDTGSESGASRGQRRWIYDAKRAGVGGAVTLIFALIVGTSVGVVQPRGAQQLVDAVAAVLPYFCSAAMGGGLTILALMLTLLSMSQSASPRLTSAFYKRIVWIGRQACAVFVGGATLLLVMATPVQKLEAGGALLYQVQFYVIVGVLALLTGVLTSTLVMLQSTLEDLVAVLGLGVKEHPLVVAQHDSSSYSSRSTEPV